MKLHKLSPPRCAVMSLSTLAMVGLLALPLAHAQSNNSQASSAVSPSVAAEPVYSTSLSAPGYSSSQPSPSESLKTEISSLALPGFDASPQYGRQTGPRRTYGRPTYSDRWSNADGSHKYGFAAGGGFTVPAGSTGRYMTTSWKFQVAGIRNFSKRYGLQLEYDYDHFGVTSGVLNKIAQTYQDANLGIDTSGLDGNAHTWSFSLNPVVNLHTSGRAGAYVIGGVGFYRKVTNFTLPTASYYCGYFSCYPITQNQTFDHYSNNAFGMNLGAGLTWKLSEFSNAKLYTEARYVWIDNQPGSSANTFYPPNNYRTGYFPITFGIRW